MYVFEYEQERFAEVLSLYIIGGMYNRQATYKDVLGKRRCYGGNQHIFWDKAEHKQSINTSCNKASQ